MQYLGIYSAFFYIIDWSDSMLQDSGQLIGIPGDLFIGGFNILLSVWRSWENTE